MAIPIAIDREAHTLGAFRACRHGDAIAYWATLESTGLQAVLAITTALFEQHYLVDHGCCNISENGMDCYAVLDILAEDSLTMLDTICVPDMAAFDHLRVSLGLRITGNDCDEGCK